MSAGVSSSGAPAAPAPATISITVKFASVSSTLQTTRTATVLSLKERISAMEEFGESAGLAVGGRIRHLAL